MKAFINFLIVLLLLSGDITAQWFQQNSGTTVNLSSIFFIDANTGWICGAGGKILKTTNSGLDWVEQNSNTTAGLNSIQFIDADNGWACGSNQILETTDGGSTWNAQSFPPPGYISALQFINLNVGWVISHNVGTSYAYKTTDGGINWNVKVQSQAEYFETLYFLNENIGWIPFCGLGVLKTTDGGNNWIQHNAYLSCSPMQIMFVDSLTGWISHNTLGSYEISKSTDGGVTWFTQIAEGGKFIHSINFPSSGIGYAAGFQMFVPPNPDQEFIMKTTDGGSNWVEQYRDYGVLNSIFFVNDTIGWAVGNDGRILTTENGGVTSVEEENSSINPKGFMLSQNYPNPFNSSTTIMYSVMERLFVSLIVYDCLGKNVKTLVDEEQGPGTYRVKFEKNNLASGMYFFRLVAGEFDQTRKMIHLK